MSSKRRKNTFTRFLEDIVDDTKGLVDDLLDRAKDVERDTREAVTDTSHDGVSGRSRQPDDGVVSRRFRHSLDELQAKIDELLEVQRRSSVATADLEAMTKAELREFAEERGITGVDDTLQTKPEMITAVRAGLRR
jgi:hypothetical protein